MPRHPWKPELWKLQLEPWELNLLELPDGGASILDLPDGDALAPLLATIHPYPGSTPYQRFIMGSTGDLGASAYRRSDAGPSIVLDARRPSVEAHLCRWLALRVLGFVPGNCTLEREQYIGSKTQTGGGCFGWCLMQGPQRVAAWPPTFGPLLSVGRPELALVALVKHYAAETAGQAPGDDARHP